MPASRTLSLLTPLLVATAATGCKVERQPEGGPFADDFAGPAIAAAWKSTGGNYRIVDGALVIDHAYNHPLWLSSPLPRDAVVELDAWSTDPAGDIKLELWGDGQSFAKQASYTASSYVFIFGGWHNTISAIARMNEHGADRRTRSDVKVVPGQHYHFRIERRAGHIDWQIDGQPFLSFDDPKPLAGPDHAYLAFNDWEAELHFDNLSVRPVGK
jgi:hypothetical protein